MKFVEKCAKDEQFNKLCPISDTMKNRYEDSELIVRFFAYLNKKYARLKIYSRFWGTFWGIKSAQ